MLSGLALVALFAVGPADVTLAHRGVARAAHRATSSTLRAARLPAVGELRLHSRLIEGGETPRGSMQLDLRLAQRRRRGATGAPSTAPATGTTGAAGAAGTTGAAGTAAASGTGGAPTPSGAGAGGGSSASPPAGGAATGGSGAAVATTADDETPTHAREGGGTVAGAGDAATATATATPAATSGDGAAAAGGGDGAAADSGGGEDEPNIELLRHRAQLTRVHRPVGIATWASMLVTEALGTIRIINAGIFGSPELCGTPNVIFGQFGCAGLTGLHGVSSFVTTALYTTTAILAASMPDPERASEGNDRRATILRLHRTFRWVHMIGMIMMPLLGVMSAHPDAFGLQLDTLVPASVATYHTFRSVVQGMHMITGYLTFTSLTASMILELI